MASIINDANMRSLFYFEETSGDRADEKGGNDLVEYNSVGYNSDSKQGTNSAEFIYTNSERFQRGTQPSGFPGGSGGSTPSDFTIGMWIKFNTDTGPFQRIYYIYDVFDLHRDSSDNLNFWTTSGANISANSTVTQDVWYHVVIRWQGSTDDELSMWVNGVKQDDYHTSISTWDSSSTRNLDIGCYRGGSSNFFDGRLDELFCMDRALSDAEIAEVYANGVYGGGPRYEDNGGVAAGTDASVDVPYPSTVDADDILIAIVGDADNDTFSTPSGWAAIHSDSANSNFSYAAFWLRAVGTESGTETFTSALSDGQVVAGIMYRFSGCKTTGDPFEDSDEDVVAQGTTANIPAMTSAGTNRLAVWMVAIEDDTGTSDDATDYDEISDLTTTTGSDMGFSLFTQQVESGSVSADSCTIGGSDYNGSVGVVLIPVGAGEAVNLTATIAAVTTTGAASLDVARALTATVAAVTSTDAASLAVTRPLTATIAAVTTTSSASLLVARALTSTVAAVTTTSTPVLSFLRALTATIAPVTTTSAPTLTRAVGLAATNAAVSTTAAASLAVARPLTATIAAVSTTSSSTLSLLVPITATIAATTSTGVTPDGWEVGAYIWEHPLHPELNVSRALTATVAAVTTTSAADLEIGGAINLTATISAVTVTSAPSLAVGRALTATAAAVTTTSAAVLNQNSVIDFTATIAAVTTTSTPVLGVTIPLTATIAAEVSTGTPSLAVARALTGQVDGVVVTPGADLVLAMALTGTIAGVTSTSAAVLGNNIYLTATIAASVSSSSAELHRDIYLTATIAAYTVTSNPNLLGAGDVSDEEGSFILMLGR
jgi:hypothetical protein